MSAYLPPATPWWRALFPRSTGCRDSRGRLIREGDYVMYLNASNSIQDEYLFPVYEVVWNPPALELRHVGGGGKSVMGSTNTLLLRHRGDQLEILSDFDSSLMKGLASRGSSI